jgi:hypothetical protein
MVGKLQAEVLAGRFHQGESVGQYQLRLQALPMPPIDITLNCLPGIVQLGKFRSTYQQSCLFTVNTFVHVSFGHMPFVEQVNAFLDCLSQQVVGILACLMDKKIQFFHRIKLCHLIRLSA